LSVETAQQRQTTWLSEGLGFSNTLLDNNATRGGGVSLSDGAITVLFNNIFWSDTASADPEIVAIGATASVQYCNVQGGWATGTGNINLDPAFVAGDTLFHLRPISPCIGRGADSIMVGGVWYRAPSWDFDGHQRHMPVGHQPPDIGAQEEMVTVDVPSEEPGIPTQFALDQNYPNPFNPSTKIGYTVAGTGHEALGTSWVKLTVYDMLGREVAVLVNQKEAPGRYEVRFNASALASGVYLYRLTAGAFVQTRKMVVVK
jgi:hypothetical protein